MVNLKNALPKLLLSVAFITVATTGAFASGKSGGSKDKGGCSSNKSSGCGGGQGHTKICHRTGNGKYILISPANPGVYNGHMGHGDSLAKNGFCPAEILPTSGPSAVADPCNFTASTPPTAAPTSGSKSSGKSGGKDKGGKSGGKSGGKTKQL